MEGRCAIASGHGVLRVKPLGKPVLEFLYEGAS